MNGLFCRAIALLALCIPLGSFGADAYPSRPVRIIVQYVPGGNVDTAARALANELGKQLGQSFYIENKPGAGGSIAYQALATAAPDGYTLGIGHIGQLALNPHLLRSIPYAPLRDFTPVARIADAPSLLVATESFQVQSLADVIAYARAHPGRLTSATPGVGTVGHLATELLAQHAGVQIISVPYKGSAQMVSDLLGGNVQIAFGGPPALLPHVKAGRLRALAVTSTTRSPAFPDLPTVAELGYPGFQMVAWMGIVAPAGIDKKIVALLNREILKAAAAPDLKRVFAANGLDIVTSSPDEFARFIASEYEAWGKFVRERNLHEE